MSDSMAAGAQPKEPPTQEGGAEIESVAPEMAPEMVPREETLEDAAEDLLAWADHLQWAAAPHTAPHHSQGLRSTGRHQQVPHHT